MSARETKTAGWWKEDKQLAPYRQRLEVYFAEAEGAARRQEEYYRLARESWRVQAARLAADSVYHSADRQLAPQVMAFAGAIAAHICGEIPYLEQYVAALAIFDGYTIEMANGEGKSLAAVLAAAAILLPNLHSGAGAPRRHIHLVTDNEYLARRDLLRYGSVLYHLGLSVGAAYTDPDAGKQYALLAQSDAAFVAEPVPARDAYRADLTYVEKERLVADYLLDNMVLFRDEQRLPPLDRAIIDEADSVLIDAAREPVIISSPRDRSAASGRWIQWADQLPAKELAHKRDYLTYPTRDSTSGRWELTGAGEEALRQRLALGENDALYPGPARWYRYLHYAICAHHFYQKGDNYLVVHGRVIPIDRMTGRLQPGKREQGGQGPALDAKEKVRIRREVYPRARITYQNFFGLYRNLVGMSATALSEREEFEKIYGLRLLPIPRRFPVIKAKKDLIYRSEEARLRAVVRDTLQRHAHGQPVLIATNSVREAQVLDHMLRAQGLAPSLLTAADHVREAQKITNAGRLGAVTIAAQMAGRGTDIKPETAVEERGGLAVLVLGRTRRRVDRQLQGRTGREGRSGHVQFYLSIDDELIRRFSSELNRRMLSGAISEDEPLDSPWLSGIIEQAQARIQRYELEVLQYALDYDNLLREQREVIYKMRERLLDGDDVAALTRELATILVEARLPGGVAEAAPTDFHREWVEKFGLPYDTFALDAAAPPEENRARLLVALEQALESRRRGYRGFALPYEPEALLLLQALDFGWSYYLDAFARIAGRAQLIHIPEQAFEQYAEESRREYVRSLAVAGAEFLSRWRHAHLMPGGEAAFVAKLCQYSSQWEASIAAAQALFIRGSEAERTQWRLTAASTYLEHLEQPEEAARLLLDGLAQTQVRKEREQLIAALEAPLAALDDNCAIALLQPATVHGDGRLWLWLADRHARQEDWEAALEAYAAAAALLPVPDLWPAVEPILERLVRLDRRPPVQAFAARFRREAREPAAAQAALQAFVSRMQARAAGEEG